MNGVVESKITSSTLLSSSSIRTSDVSQKYAGMIELSTYKKTRNALFQLFDYVGQTAPSFYGLRTVCSIWRIIQYFGPTFVPRYYEFWGKGTVMNTLANILSVFSHILPGSIRDFTASYMLLAYIVIFLIAYIGLLASSLYFTKNAKLPKIVPAVISVFMATIGYLFQPIAITFAFETIGRMITRSDEFVNPFNIVVVILTFVVLAIYLWMFSTVYSVTITFKPDSLQVTIPSVQVLIIFATLVINGLIGLASELTKYPRLAITGVTAILCFVFISFLFQKGGLVSRNYEKALGASSFAEGILFIVVIVYEIIGIRGSEVIIFIVLGVWLISFFLFHWYFERRALRFINILDMIEDDPENFQLIKSPTQLEGIAVNGFRFAHPVCLSWQLFKLGIERWPQNVDIWLLFAKMTAIYPEETQQLNWISLGMSQNKLKGSLAKHTMQQIGSIIKQRETNLIPELKSKIDKVAKQVQGTKHKVRYIWDLIIQGNIKELEVVISRAYHAIDHCEADFLHLIRQFPNSRFVARSYARFLRDVVADHAGHKVWAQNVSLLQRGISVFPDKAHELGLRAFPLLPKTLDAHVAVQATQGMVTDDTLTQDIDGDDEQAAIDAEVRMSVRESINKLVIPSFRTARIIRVISFFILYFVPVIFLCVYLNVYINSLTYPLNFMFTLSKLRTELLQLVGVGFHFVCERLLVINRPDSGDPPPVTFGTTHNSSKQVLFLAQEIVDQIPNLTSMMDYAQGNANMDLARDFIFGNMIDFKVILDVNADPTIKKISITQVLMEYVVLLRELIQLSDLNDPNNYNDSFPVSTIMNSKYVSIPFNNIQEVTENMSTALELIRAYVDDNYQNIHKISTIAMFVIIFGVILAYIIFVVVIIKEIQRDKMMIYKCLASLPKNIVSKVADSFKVLKKEEDDEMKTSQSHDEEFNKQEENVLKIFATSSDTGNRSATDTIFIIGCTIMLLISYVIVVAFVCQFVDKSAQQLNESAPHIDYIMGSYTYDFSSLIVLIMLGASFKGHNVYRFPHDEMINVINKWQSRGITTYHMSRFGDEETGTKPFYGFSVGLDEQTPLTGCDARFIPMSDHDVYKCWSADLLTSYIQMTIHSYVQTHVKYYESKDPQLKAKANFSLFERNFDDMWHMHQVHLYERYFSPMFSKIIGNVVDLLHKDLSTIIGLSIAMLVVGIISEGLLLNSISTSEQHQKFALRLLLQCPGSAVVSNMHITALLAGNFSEKHIDSTTRDAEFYDVIVQDLPDSVLTLDMDGKILTANSATNRIFGIKPEELIQQSIVNLGDNFKGENPFAFFKEKVVVTEALSFEKSLAYSPPNGNEIHVEISLIVLAENIIVTTRDVTQTVMYNKLISDERQKSDKLLSSILPPRLVARVQAGEKNISFSVQSASIVFMDIVSFTPWCGSLPAATVMKTLNLMFKENDALVAMHSTMTKIKCIGDCYMAAGGIFMDVNQPAQHAKDVVEFGLDAIEALEKINEDINQSLQIRVGVNTGGPIVAGVLGTAKPTFEILGPAINMAQQMEHHGVPMKVHVSRAVYELIYGGSFQVKERGEIQLKNGPAVTYLIDKRERIVDND
ncbi:Adenylate and Guanylate cyclase catalytic domain containing protein [Tritrichomonas foetus]|uniref:Adenylate and Guanylate cyclase catalytic domain containing protein n=1 Tax=Tritrichomonas foetus TaxID=1144522 RepID=A0A1J4KRM0_9EUKA|nr:Adenylate and Guanylate cyclase catalytic domain containing protein [Tritrichomonas foetus]|eukprot:OHT13730.1 Adenylate and Guanylate cyclase catalytic domain containing protein [Tritrichomonas foetus]